MFGDYYTEKYEMVSSIPMMDSREFGFASFEGWMRRHKNFETFDALKEFVKVSVPSDVYCSCAYYEDPNAEMDKKGWLGADLVFDIDADHIPTTCDRIHDSWACGVCGLTGKGSSPRRCPACHSRNFETNTWPCEFCLNIAKAEAAKVSDILIQDFGLPKKDIRLFFSGHRGYHVIVESEVTSALDSMGRKEIVDYVSGLGLDLAFHGLAGKSLRILSSPRESRLRKLGWGNRLDLGFRHFMKNAGEGDLSEIGIKRKIIERILANKDIIVEKWSEQGTLGAVKGIGVESWGRIAEHVARLESAKIDTVVTTDIHRLVRLSDTLHSKTGLRKTEFPISAVDDFDPFRSAVAFKSGATKVLVSDAPEFRMGDETFGPYANERVELPTAAAVLLVCKGRAEVTE